MDDKRNLTIGVKFGLQDSVTQIGEVIDRIDDIKAGFMAAEDAGARMGSEAARSAGMLSDELQDARSESQKVTAGMNAISDAGENVGDSIRDTGREFDKMGTKAAENADDAKRGLQEAAEAADEFGSEVARNAGSAARDIDDVTDAANEAGDEMDQMGDQVEQSYIKMGAGAKNFREAVIRTSAAANRETNSIAKTIKAGLQGAYGFAGKRADEFKRKAVAGAENVKDAFEHPIQTIKGKFSEALHRARDSLDNVGDEADRTGDNLDDMGKDGENAGTSIKDAMGSAVKSFFAISAAIEVVKAGIDVAKQFGSALLEAGKNAEQTGAKFDAAFSADSGVAEWAENFAGAIHRSEKEVQGFLVSNKAMYNELGITGEAATDLSKITTSLAYDLGTAFKMDDAEALGVMQDYINGNTSALAEYGIQINDTVLKQSAMEMGLGQNIDGLDDAAMAQVRMNALLKNSTEIQQQAAQKQEGYTNGLKSLNGIWQDFLSNAAERFEPVFSNLVGTMLDSWPQVEPILMGLVDMLSNGIAAGAPVIMDLAQNAIPPLMDILGQLGSVAAPVGGILLSIGTTVLPPLARMIGNIATTVAPPLVSILKTLNDNVIAPLMPHVESMVNALLPALASGLRIIPPILQTISPVLSGIASVLSTVVGFLSKIIEYVGNGVGAVLEKVAGLFGGGSSVKSAGAKIPHNADGDLNFRGGWTHINERGGEMAYLPSGSTIIPADKSDKIINNSNSTKTTKTDINFNPTIKVEIHGDGGGGTKWTDDLKQMVKELYQEMQSDQNDQLAIQQGNA